MVALIQTRRRILKYLALWTCWLEICYAYGVQGHIWIGNLRLGVLAVRVVEIGIDGWMAEDLNSRGASLGYIYTTIRLAVRM